MLKYNPHSKNNARSLRKSMTDCEQLLWSRLRRKQISGIQFYRQKPLGNYIVDFYALKAKLVIELDGSQHLAGDHVQKDMQRDMYLQEQGLQVLRFNNMQVLQELDGVMAMIFDAIK